MEKFSDLQKMDNKVLKEKVNLLRKESLNLRFQKNSGQLEKTARISLVRKQIARIKTLINSNKKRKWRHHAKKNFKRDSNFWQSR